VGEGAAEELDPAFDHATRDRVPARGPCHDLVRAARRSARVAVRALECGTRQERLHAAALPAVAGRATGVDRVVAPFAGDVLRPGPQPAVDDDAAADAGAENDREDELATTPRAVTGLRQREAVRVVLEHDAKPEPRGEVRVETAPVQTDRVRVLE